MSKGKVEYKNSCNKYTYGKDFVVEIEENIDEYIFFEFMSAYRTLMEQIKKVVTNVPIIANGNVITWEDVEKNLVNTDADGIMSAEGLLDNPALFYPSSSAGKRAAGNSA